MKNSTEKQTLRLWKINKKLIMTSAMKKCLDEDDWFLLNQLLNLISKIQYQDLKLTDIKQFNLMFSLKLGANSELTSEIF